MTLWKQWFCAEVSDIGWGDLERGEKSVRPGETTEGFLDVVAFNE